MGSAWSGTPAQQIGQISNFNPEQSTAFNQFARNLGQGGSYDLAQNPLYQQASQALSKSPYLQQFNPSQYEQYFQQGVANPAIRNYEQQILPQIKNQYYTPHGVYGSALNRAINQSAEGLTRGLGELRANYLQQGQQSHQQNQLAAIAQALGLAQAPIQQSQQGYSTLFGARPVTPLVQEAQSGWLQDLLKLLAQQTGNAVGTAAKFLI